MPCPSRDAPPEDEAPASTTQAAPDNLARLVAHAINNPLAALLLDLDSAVELLETDPSGDEGKSRIDDARRLLGEMRKSAMRVHAVVDDLRRTRTTADAVHMLSVAPSVAAAPNAAPRIASKAAVAHVLVVDDDALVASAVKRSLREHDVVVQGSARDALELFEAGQRFDVVLCDLMMPDVTGMDLYDAVSKIDPAQAARMVFVTGGAVTTRAREFVATTDNQVVDKPFDVHELREIIARHLK
jgi:CheY-like chemotaxis protein